MAHLPPETWDDDPEAFHPHPYWKSVLWDFTRDEDTDTDVFRPLTENDRVVSRRLRRKVETVTPSAVLTEVLGTPAPYRPRRDPKAPRPVDDSPVAPTNANDPDSPSSPRP